MPSKGDAQPVEDAPLSLADLQAELVQVQATPEECRRLEPLRLGLCWGDQSPKRKNKEKLVNHKGAGVVATPHGVLPRDSH